MGGKIGDTIMGGGGMLAGGAAGAAGAVGGGLQNLGILNWLNNRGSGGGGSATPSMYYTTGQNYDTAGNAIPTPTF
jgi:hypothetical protein